MFIFLDSITPDEVSTTSVKNAFGKYTWQEVAKHNTEESTWVIIDGDVFDITGMKLHHRKKTFFNPSNFSYFVTESLSSLQQIYISSSNVYNSYLFLIAKINAF